MIDIVVVGYPKSGSTWATRLIAELVGCPVTGYLGSTHDETAREGLLRESNYQCYKSHHAYHELANIPTNEKKIIYIVRDPRDVCVSGAHYFKIERHYILYKLLRIFVLGIRPVYKFLKQFMVSPSYRINRMSHAVLHGDANVHSEVGVSWAEHYKPYVENGCFCVKYEDLLSNPELECRRILDFIGVERSDASINNAIHSQSFNNKKADLINSNQPKLAKFLRSGKQGQWKYELSPEQQAQFDEILADELHQFGYPLSHQE